MQGGSIITLAKAILPEREESRAECGSIGRSDDSVVNPVQNADRPTCNAKELREKAAVAVMEIPTERVRNVAKQPRVISRYMAVVFSPSQSIRSTSTPSSS